MRAIAGTYVVLLAMNPLRELPDSFRGFAIERGTASGPPHWLTGIKYFSELVPNPIKGATYSSRDHPFQTFFWSDYAAAPDTTYTFTIVPRYGVPGQLTDGPSLDVRVTTEPEDDGKHGVWFNRGVVASHKFAQEFQNHRLTDAMANDVDRTGHLNSAEARWLSRGLTEACLAFINRTTPGEGLRVCAYELTYVPVLAAFKAAIERGVDVKIVYHAVKPNEDAIAAVGLPPKARIGNRTEQILFQRTRPEIPHNKFIVKLLGGRAQKVWTGSTNFTATGFFGQTNVAHVVTDRALASSYLEYWTALAKNPTPKPARATAARLTPNPPNVIGRHATVAFYSPRASDHMLDWYRQRLTDTCNLAMITLPFNVAPAILNGLADAPRSLRLAILETEPSQVVLDAERQNHGKLAFSNGAILGKTFVHRPAGGAKVVPISQGNLDDWFISEELARPTNEGHVFFVHSKILLVDPLSTDPLVCAGSANFSTNSLTKNDENMLLIRSNTRVADIYLTELDRVFKHFYDRDAINRSAELGQKPAWLHLDETRAWIDGNFRPGSYKHNRLLAFFPPHAAARYTWSAAARQDPDVFADERS